MGFHSIKAYEENCAHRIHPPIWLNDALKRMDLVFARMYESGAKGGGIARILYR